jgi:HD-GYP domain-containing protein (c-di-GMP phosphodiesterase class II)
MSIVDTFDAITSDRPYRKNLGYDKAVQEIKDNLGKQFDARMAKTFLEAWKAGEIEQSPSAFEKTQRIFAGKEDVPLGSTSLK